MTAWPVIVERWQYECCGRPVAIGQSVEWTLALRADSPGLSEARVSFDPSPDETRKPQFRRDAVGLMRSRGPLDPADRP